MTVLPKAPYRFKTIRIKIPTQFFTDLERTIINYIWKNKKAKYSQDNPVGITILDNKLYYRAILMKTAWY